MTDNVEVDLVHGAEISINPYTRNQEYKWTWAEPRRGEHFHRCSYCGSVNPDELAAEPSWKAEWADMKYGWPHKFYVDIPNRNPDALFVLTSGYGGTNVKIPQPGDFGHVGTYTYVMWDDLTPEQMAIVERDGSGERDGRHPHYIGFGTRTHHNGKFYSVHLADPAISADTKEAIQRVCGLKFTWLKDGRVGWLHV